MCAKWVDKTLRSRVLTATLAIAAIAGTVVAAEAAMIDQYIPDNERLQTFGGFRDGTYAALIAIVSIVMQFVQAIYRDRVNEKAAIERTNQATIYADALRQCHDTSTEATKRIEDAINRWSRERPCIMRHKEDGNA